jgi:serine/threonine-protein kinase
MNLDAPDAARCSGGAISGPGQADDPPDDGAADADDPPAARGGLRPGSVVGRYTLSRRLGMGGMGVVYAAHDPHLGRDVALKLLRRPERSRNVATQLLQEAVALAQLSHPNVVAVYDVGSQEGVVFISMELVEGQTLRDWLDERARSWQEILPIFLEIADGLVATHRAGVLHLDIKPENILLDADGRPRITDFGLAKFAAADDPSSLKLRGTPAYMAPEQFVESPSPASDQYGFCVSLWEAIYGARPFAATTMLEAYRATREAPTAVVPEQSKAPRRFAEILRRGLLPDPAARYPSIADLAAELRACRRRLERPKRLLRMGAIGAGLAALGVAGWLGRGDAPGRCQGGPGLIGAVWDAATAERIGRSVGAMQSPGSAEAWTRLAPQLDAYGARWSGLYRETCEAHEAGAPETDQFDARMACLDQRRTQLGAVVALLTSDRPAVVVGAMSAAHALPAVNDCAAPDIMAGEAALPEAPELRATVEAIRRELAVSTANLDAGLLRDALDKAERAATRAEPVPYPPVKAEAQLNIGVAAMHLGRYDDAERALVRSDMLAEANGLNRIRARAATYLARLLGFDESRPEVGMTWAGLADGSLAAIGTPPILEADLLTARGTILYGTADYAESLEVHHRALAIRRRELGPNHPAIWETHNALSTAYLGVGDFKAAEGHAQQALDAGRRVLGEDHPWVAMSYNNLGNAHFRQGDLAHAVEDYAAARRSWSRFFGADHQLVAVAMVNLANVYAETGDLQRALQFYRDALAIEEKQRGTHHPDLLTSLANLSGAYSGLGRYAEALEVDRRALRIARFAGVGADLRFAIHARIADSLRASRSYPSAAASYRDAILTGQRFDIEPTALAHVQLGLADALWSEPGERAEALSIAKDALAVAPPGSDERAEVESWLAAR